MPEQDPAQDVEEAVRAHARAIVAGDIGAAIRSMTPEGLAGAMEVGNTTWNIASYELEPGGRDGDDHLFAIRYETDLGQMRLRYRVREVDGRWKVTHVEQEG